jgi:hypothetical protein
MGLLTISPGVLASYSPAVSFFRSPQSLFPSGQAPLSDLARELKSEITVNFYQVRKDDRELRLEAGSILRDLDLCSRALDTKTGQVGRLTRFLSPWYEFENEKGDKSWKLAEDLAPLPDDLGLAYAYVSHPLRKSPSWKSESEGQAQVGQKFRVLSFDGEFIKVQTLQEPSITGYLELSNVILKIDFASFIMEKGESWKPFSYREQQFGVLRDQRRMKLAEVAGIITRPELGVASRLLPEAKLVPRSTVEIKRGEWVQWAESALKGHGRVFWKKAERLTGLKEGPEWFTTEEILGKHFFSVAVHPKNPQQALVSAQGVYFTDDGKVWTKLPTFKDENQPVAIGERGELFVGSFRSLDKGKTFHPYLRWEDLTSLLEIRHRRTPGLLKLAEVKPVGNEKVEITVDTGAWKAWLTGSTRYGLVTDWKVLREN